MKALSKFLIIISVLILLFTNGCVANNNTDTDAITFNNNKYELSRHDFSVYGNSFKSNGYLCYGSKDCPEFIEEKVLLFDEGLIYHLSTDNYPNVRDYERIEKITLTDGNIVKEIDYEHLYPFAELLCFENIDKDLLIRANQSNTMWWSVEIYYKNYPAYQTTWMIVESDDNVGIMYCETVKNTSMFGENNMYIINDDLAEYIKSLLNE